MVSSTSVCILLCVLAPVATADTCLGGWPLFPNRTALMADKWGAYYTKVYGEVPSDPSAYPWCVGDGWLFYDDIIRALNITNIPKIVGQCPSHNGIVDGDRYTGLGVRSASYCWPTFVSWSWHATNTSNTRQARKPFADNTWVEVMHKAKPADERIGAWFLYAKGSGMWINLGRTIAFNASLKYYGHKAAEKFFNVTPDHSAQHLRPDEVMSRNAGLAGYDSVQMLQGWPETCTGTPGSTKMAGTMNYEIVSTRLVGATACTSPDGKSPMLRSGWMAKHNCTCTNNVTKSKSFINCAEVQHPPYQHDHHS